VTWPDLWRSAAFFGVAGLLALVTIRFQYHNVIGHYLVRTDDFWSRLALAGRAVWFYFFKAVLPLGLMPVYPRWPTDGVTPVSFVPGLLLAAFFLVCWRWRAGWGRALLFGCGYAVVMLLPVLGFLNMYYYRFSLVADHWQYFAIIGLITLAAAGITVILNPFPKGKLVFSGGVLLWLGILTWRQCGWYASPETLWAAAVDRNPGSWVAHNNLGEALFEEGREKEGVAQWQTAIKLYPGNGLAWFDLGVASLHTGQVAVAVTDYEQALQFEPYLAGACNDLAWVLATSPIPSLRNGPKALELARRACQSADGRNLPKTLGTLAAADASVGNFTEAVATLNYALQMAAAQNELEITNHLVDELKFYSAHMTFRDLSLTNTALVNQ